MQARLFEARLDNKVENNINKAIKALNDLIDYYKKNEESNGTNLMIKMQTPWDRHTLWGGSAGIGGTLLLEPMPKQHALFDSLQTMGFQIGTCQLEESKFIGIFSLYDAKLIAEIPKQCQETIKENTNKKSASN